MTNLIQKIYKQAKLTFSFTNDFEQNLTELHNLMDQLTAKDVNLDISYAEHPPENEIYAPISYINIFEDETVSIGIFVLKPYKILPLHNHPDMHGLIKVLAGKVSVESYSLNTPKALSADQFFKNPSRTEVATSTTDLKEQLDNTKNRNIQTKDAAIQTNKVFVEAGTSTSSDSNSYSSISSILDSLVFAQYSQKGIVNTTSKPSILKPFEKNIHEIRSMEEPAAFLDILAPPYLTTIPNVGPRVCKYFTNMGLIYDDVFLLREIQPPDYYWTDNKPYLGPDPTVEA